MKTNYQKMAKNILAKMNVSMVAKFVKCDYHFQDDDERRDIFFVSFHRENKSFSLRFGQSVAESTGSGKNIPSEYDIIACIQKYDVGSFNNFCGDFGYTFETTREQEKVEKVYNAVCKEYEKVSSFFTEKEIDILSHIN